MKFEVSCELAMNAQTYWRERQSPPFLALMAKHLHMSRMEVVSHVEMEGMVTQILVNEPNISLPYLVQSYLGSSNIVFTDTLTFPTIEPTDQVYEALVSTTNNITSKSEVSACLRVEPLSSSTCRQTFAGEAIINISGIGSIVESIIVSQLKSSYKQLPAIVEEWVRIQPPDSISPTTPSSKPESKPSVKNPSSCSDWKLPEKKESKKEREGVSKPALVTSPILPVSNKVTSAEACQISAAEVPQPPTEKWSLEHSEKDISSPEARWKATKKLVGTMGDTPNSQSKPLTATVNDTPTASKSTNAALESIGNAAFDNESTPSYSQYYSCSDLDGASRVSGIVNPSELSLNSNIASQSFSFHDNPLTDAKASENPGHGSVRSSVQAELKQGSKRNANARVHSRRYLQIKLLFRRMCVCCGPAFRRNHSAHKLLDLE